MQITDHLAKQICAALGLPEERRAGIAAASSLRNSGIGIGSSVPPVRALRRAFIAERKKLVTVTPGTACGYWKARKRPF